jgi:hypothetical protein
MINVTIPFEMSNAIDAIARKCSWSSRETKGALYDLIYAFRSIKSDRMARSMANDLISASAVDTLVQFNALIVENDHVIAPSESFNVKRREYAKAGGKRKASVRQAPAKRKLSVSLPPVCPQVQDHIQDQDQDHDQILEPVSLKPEPEPPKPKSEHHELIQNLCDEFQKVRGEKYIFASRDAKVVKDLRATAPPEQIFDAWAKALRHVGYPSVGSLAQFQQHINFFVGSGPPPSAQNQPFKNSKNQQEKNLKTGIIGEDLVRDKCAVCGDEGHTFAAGKSWLCGEHYQAWRELADKHKLFDDNDPAVQKFIRLARGEK